MSAFAILDTYFKSKEIQGHFETVKSLHVYANKLNGQKTDAGTPRDIRFFKTSLTKSAKKGMKSGLKILQAAEKENPEWPDDYTLLFFKSMLRAADKSGTNSTAFKNSKKNYENKCKFYGKELAKLLARLTLRRVGIDKNRKLAQNMSEYCTELSKVFLKISNIPSKITTGEQYEWLALSESSIELKGYAASSIAALGRIKTANEKAIKTCKKNQRQNQLWIKWITSSKPEEEGAIKKNLKSAKPR